MTIKRIIKVDNITGSCFSRPWQRILSWNCRGLGHLSAVPTLKNLIRSHKPDFIFLYETLVNENKIEDVCRKIGFNGCFAVDREGRGGGVAFFGIIL